MTFTPDRKTYVQTHWTMAAVFMGLGMLILWLMGNPHVWTGAIGGLAAVALRGWYLMDEALSESWTLQDGVLNGPGGRKVPLSNLKTARALGSAVQLVTTTGDKHLIKFQADPAAVIADIEAARRAAPKGTHDA